MSIRQGLQRVSFLEDFERSSGTAAAAKAPRHVATRSSRTKKAA